MVCSDFTQTVHAMPCIAVIVQLRFLGKKTEKVSLITGGSSGIGAEIARHLASLGYGNLAIVAHRNEKLEEVLVTGYTIAGNL